MKLQQIAPRATDRAIFYGWTGCGKTTLARYLLRLRTDVPVWVFDWKAQIDWPEYERYTSLEKFLRRNPARGIYAPNVKEHNNENYWDAFFHACYRKKKIQIYVDEVYAVTKRNEIPDWYQACLTRGRQQGTSTYSATQRPKEIPQVVMSEAEHNYIFRLKMPQDREKVEKMTGVSAEMQFNNLSLEKHNFYYADAETRFSGVHTLRIKR
jgi:hypothetical protein